MPRGKKRELTPRERAAKAAAKYNAGNKGKIYRMVKISDNPLTYKEVMVTE